MRTQAVAAAHAVLAASLAASGALVLGIARDGLVVESKKRDAPRFRSFDYSMVVTTRDLGPTTDDAALWDRVLGDAICTTRPYARAHSREFAVRVLTGRVGTFHSPALVANFARMVGVEPSAPEPGG